MKCALCGSPQGAELTPRGISTLNGFFQQLHNISSSSAAAKTLGGGSTPPLCGDCLCDMTLATERAQKMVGAEGEVRSLQQQLLHSTRQLQTLVGSFLEGMRPMEENAKKRKEDEGISGAIINVVRMLSGFRTTTASKFPAPPGEGEEVPQEIVVQPAIVDMLEIMMEEEQNSPPPTTGAQEDSEPIVVEEPLSLLPYFPRHFLDTSTPTASQSLEGERQEEEEETGGADENENPENSGADENENPETSARLRHATRTSAKDLDKEVVVLKLERFIWDKEALTGLTGSWNEKKCKYYAAYHQQHKKWSETQDPCPVCGKMLCRSGLKQHIINMHKVRVRIEYVDPPENGRQIRGNEESVLGNK